ncbi:molecular chaperone DnaJ [Stigmatella sp. ncwal1]|uniref:Molecular chaperone DnaJ n=1 Tax=Stigmatella ashevillensis TaxID=2995309 RepID=A0ABT5D9X1_9BACT|nr:molecular chaperone DnaJ [Stigmatella ashevillena]MDC0709865.1 molecular chaperone DnaJ [Stigmatella ashevillena]
MEKGAQTPPDPTSAEMQSAWRRAEGGDVAGARREAHRILASSPSPEDRAQAEELLRRTRTPRSVYGFALLAVGILVLLVTLALSRY